MRRSGILIFTLLFFSCKSSIPKDVLPPKKMQAVLWDVMQADELAEYYSGQDSSFTSLSKHIGYYQRIFAIHKIRKEDFAKSLDYYENHPAQLKPILDSLQTFGGRQSFTDSSKTTLKPLVDSARKKHPFPVKHHP